jgi:hypothetical protein
MDSWFVTFENTEHANINFCVLLHKSPSETLQILEEPYGKGAMKKMQAYK